MKALALVLLLVGCAHKVGDPCFGSDAFCADSRTSLACRDGKLSVFPCNGNKGCALAKDRVVTCDQSAGAVVGDLCYPEYNGTAQCTPSGTGYLFCADGRWKEMTCGSPAKCVDGPSGLTCK